MMMKISMIGMGVSAAELGLDTGTLLISMRNSGCAILYKMTETFGANFLGFVCTSSNWFDVSPVDLLKESWFMDMAGFHAEFSLEGGQTPGPKKLNLTVYHQVTGNPTFQVKDRLTDFGGIKIGDAEMKGTLQKRVEATRDHAERSLDKRMFLLGEQAQAQNKARTGSMKSF